MRDNILELIDKLLAVSKQQVIYLNEHNINKFLELSDQRQTIIDKLFKEFKDLDDNINDIEIRDKLEQIRDIDKENIDTLKSMISDNRHNLSDLGLKAQAFYKYIGKEGLEPPEPRFIDKKLDY